MKKNMKIYIWGTGKIATQYMACNEIPNENLCGIIETQKSKNIFCNKPVLTPDDVVDKEYDYIIVCVYDYANEIFDLCNHIGLDKIKLYY